MQVTETNSEGLKREFKIVVPAQSIEDSVTQKLQEVGKDVKMPGFRPGKVPMSLLRKKYGSSVMGEVLEQMVQDTMVKTLEERELKPAARPDVKVDSFDEGQDLEYSMSVELLPDMPDVDFAALTLERPKAEASDEEVSDILTRFAESRRSSEPVEESRPAASGDVAVIDFTGRRDGEEFEGGKAEDFQIELGSGSFIPGFEDEVIGLSPGEKKTFEVTFPEEYPHAELAGKPVEFDVEVKELRQPVTPEVTDEMAKETGFDGLDALKDAARGQIQSEHDQLSRMHVKRSLFDKLDEAYDFELPPSLEAEEFDAIWKQYEQDRDAGRLSEEDKAKDEEALKEEYRRIARRRVKLGLLLSEVGSANNIEVTQEDLNQALMQEAQRYPGQEQAVIKYYTENPDAVQSLRAPIFEDKVVDFVLELAQVEDKPVTPEELRKDPDAEPEEAEQKPAKKSSGAKKKAASTGGGAKSKSSKAKSAEAEGGAETAEGDGDT